jgi:RNA polymerase sigma factor (sigma-70 family)
MDDRNISPLFNSSVRPTRSSNALGPDLDIPLQPIDRGSPYAGLEASFLANRDALLRFLGARGAGDAAEDLLHEVWLKVSRLDGGQAPVAAPLAYLYRVANSLMIDRYRASRQAVLRDSSWAEGQADPLAVPTPERVAIGRNLLEQVARRLDELGTRPAAVFRRHRIDGLAQRQIADEFGVSLSTVESDLRAAYRAIAEFREQSDEA